MGKYRIYKALNAHTAKELKHFQQIESGNKIERVNYFPIGKENPNVVPTSTVLLTCML
jgi:hypothetical protein